MPCLPTRSPRNSTNKYEQTQACNESKSRKALRKAPESRSTANPNGRRKVTIGTAIELGLYCLATGFIIGWHLAEITARAKEMKARRESTKNKEKKNEA